MALAAEVSASIPRKRDGVTELPIPFNSILSKRNRDEAKDTAIDRRMGHVRKRAKKRAVRVEWALANADHALEPVTKPGSISARAGSSCSQAIPDPPYGTACLESSIAEPVAMVDDKAGSFPQSLQESFAVARDEIQHLHDTIAKQAQRHTQEQLWLKQELMLDMLQRHEKASQTVEKLKREKYHLTQYANEQKAEVEKQKKKAEEEEMELSKVRLELAYHKSEEEHLQALKKIMEEDLEELRQIENEDSAQRQRSKDLPPAYGSLDDDDQFPSPYLHQDSGGFGVARFKRTARENFMHKLNTAQKTSDALRSSPNPRDSNRSSTVIFTQTSFALSDSCRSLRTALEHAESAFCTKIDVQLPKLSVGDSKGSKYFYLAKRQSASPSFVADRIAKTVLDLTWRVISASELRPQTLRLERREKTRLNLAYQEADECLLEALRLTFTLNRFGFGKSSLVWECQYYSTQLCALRRAFGNLHANLSYSLFSKTLAWIDEQVVTERMNQANRSRDDEEALEMVASDQMSGSDVSSEDARMSDESGDESC